MTIVDVYEEAAAEAEAIHERFVGRRAEARAIHAINDRQLLRAINAINADEAVEMVELVQRLRARRTEAQDLLSMVPEGAERETDARLDAAADRFRKCCRFGGLEGLHGILIL